MKQLTRYILASSLWLCVASFAFAQEMTEIYIPIGQSPGLSGTLTDIGQVSRFDPATGKLTVQTPSGPRTMNVMDSTHIWLDRSKLKRSNQEGDVADLQAGRTVEVKYVDPQVRAAAYWIKIEATN